ncbi:glycosyltransferase family 4 protein [Sediminibacterium roseum]|uniref:Glycosyltransferase family 4 protein n=1 Tax=Sediminibacterium roseum TaxID=1978412 RepID=A0ABW9ZR39_9BACT|nr:glycosyltransferase family 4 protein [Sediminibacterium roseum]NCI49570.1 glycosyltransferase family 4 protein [Sediminibacterium roseum]
MEKPSVLGIISYKVFPAQMGGQKCASQFYAHLARYTKVVLAVSKDNTAVDETVKNIHPILYHHRWGFANLLRVFRLRKLIKQENIDVVCIDHSYLGWLGVVLRWLTKKPFVIHSHNIEAHRFRDMHKSLWRVYMVYEKWAHRKADHSFFITEEDRQWAIGHYELEAGRSSVVTCGTTISEAIAQNERLGFRNQLIAEHHLRNDTRLFLFNGTLDYLPNTDALRIIVTELLGLLQAMRFPFRIFVCGNKLSGKWQRVLAGYPEIIYKGFVNDIGMYCKGTDCMINPVTLGSGIKTKLVESLAYNQPCISTESGAKGIPVETAGPNLVVVPDYDWPAFANSMRVKSMMVVQADTLPAFYQMFSWDAIVQKALLSLQTL